MLDKFTRCADGRFALLRGCYTQEHLNKVVSLIDKAEENWINDEHTFGKQTLDCGRCKHKLVCVVNKKEMVTFEPACEVGANK